MTPEEKKNQEAPLEQMAGMLGQMPEGQREVIGAYLLGVVQGVTLRREEEKTPA